MRPSKLRIAVIIACAFACLLLFVLWARSYWRADQIDTREDPVQWYVTSAQGHISLERYSDLALFATRDWDFTTSDPRDVETFANLTRLGFYIEVDLNAHIIVIPYWFLTIVPAAIGALALRPWLRWQFSLRTLLIAMTVVAAALGVAMFVARR